MIEVPLQLLDYELGSIPSYAKPGDAAVDLLARTNVTIAAGGGRALIPTGVAIALPPGHCALVLSRSGLAVHHGVACLNAPGLIDSGYRGEIQVILVNTDADQAYEVTRGDRIAQLMVLVADQVRFGVVETLDESERGAGGFGHTGR